MNTRQHSDRCHCAVCRTNRMIKLRNDSSGTNPILSDVRALPVPLAQADTEPAQNVPRMQKPVLGYGTRAQRGAAEPGQTARVRHVPQIKIDDPHLLPDSVLNTMIEVSRRRNVAFTAMKDALTAGDEARALDLLRQFVGLLPLS